MNSITAYVLSQSYTDASIVGLGAVKGANCTIDNVVTNPDGTTTMTFKWTGTDGSTKTTDVVIPQGEQGKSVSSMDIVDGKLIITMDDGSTLAPVQMPEYEAKEVVLSDGKTVEEAIEELKKGESEGAGDVPPIDFDTDW